MSERDSDGEDVLSLIELSKSNMQRIPHSFEYKQQRQIKREKNHQEQHNMKYRHTS